MEIFEDANLECAIICEAKWLIERGSIGEAICKGPACEENNNTSERQHFDDAVLATLWTRPLRAIHGFYAIHSEK